MFEQFRRRKVSGSGGRSGGARTLGGRGRPQSASGRDMGASSRLQVQRAGPDARHASRQREPLRSASGPECIRFGIWGGVCASSLCAECAVLLHILAILSQIASRVITAHGRDALTRYAAEVLFGPAPPLARGAMRVQSTKRKRGPRPACACNSRSTLRSKGTRE
jgi:hypothetical protein